MAVPTFDTSNSDTKSTGTALSAAVTVANVANRIAIANVSIYTFGATQAIDTITFDGHAMTLIGSDTALASVTVYSYYYIGPGTGSKTCSVTLHKDLSIDNSVAILDVEIYDDVIQSSPIDGFHANSGVTAAPSTDLIVVAYPNTLVIGHAAGQQGSGNGINTGSGNGTQRFYTTNTDSISLTETSVTNDNPQVNPGSQTISWVATNSFYNWAAIGFGLRSFSESTTTSTTRTTSTTSTSTSSSSSSSTSITTTSSSTTSTSTSTTSSTSLSTSTTLTPAAGLTRTKSTDFIINTRKHY